MPDTRDPCEPYKTPDGQRVRPEAMPVQAPIMRNVRQVPVAEWPKKPGEQVLLWVVHPNAEFCTGKDRDEWQGWCAGYWTERSKSWPHGHDKGWVWNGMMGHITHVAPLPPAPEGAA